MWKYENVTRQELESVKDIVEKHIVTLGGNRKSIDLPYTQNRYSCIGDNFVKKLSIRPVFEFMGQFYRVDEICFPNKPFIVIECGTYDDLIKNTMEDTDPFPYDLTADALLQAVRYSLGIDPYPEDF